MKTLTNMIEKTKKPPGKKLIKKMPLKTKYWFTATGGLILISIGFLFFMELISVEAKKIDETTIWIFKGLSLLAINAGLVIFGKSITLKTLLEIKKEQKERQKKFKKRAKNEEKTEDKLPPIMIQKNPQI